MLVSEELINEILREIDDFYFTKKEIKSSDAQDLSIAVSWIEGKSLNESNISYVIESLRQYKKTMNKKAVSSIINSFRKICGNQMSQGERDSERH